MAIIKSYTDISQFLKKLAKILPIESADMYWYLATKGNPKAMFNEGYNEYGDFELPCWLLASLLGVSPVTAKLLKDGNISNTGDIKYTCECSMINIHKWFDNPIDACYEMILKSHELNLL